MKEENLTTGGIISATLNLFFSNFMSFFWLVAIVNIPELLWQMYIQFGINPDYMTDERAVKLGIINLLITLCLWPISSSIVTYGIFQKIKGNDVDFSECFRIGLGRIWVVLGTGIISFLLTMIGTMLFIIPGLIVAGYYFVAIPVVVVEKKGVFESLGRSKELTEGYKKIILSAAVGLGFIVGICQGILSAVWQGNQTLTLLIGFPTEIVAGAILAILPVMTYYMLRRDKENANIEELASVFD